MAVREICVWKKLIFTLFLFAVDGLKEPVGRVRFVDLLVPYFESGSMLNGKISVTRFDKTPVANKVTVSIWLQQCRFWSTAFFPVRMQLCSLTTLDSSVDHRPFGLPLLDITSSSPWTCGPFAALRLSTSFAYE
ncbi:hypothetical protein F2P79_020310 [Pimephales promelas]|nr:hypothetical protein F2P79_020310 [Pimephales promelas]